MIKTVEQKVDRKVKAQILKALNSMKLGVYSIEYASTKEALGKSRVTKAPTPTNFKEVTVVRKATFNFTRQEYKDLVAKGTLAGAKDPTSKRAGMTYAKPVNRDKTLWKYTGYDGVINPEKVGTYYLRLYKMGIVGGIAEKFLGAYDAEGTKMSHGDYEAWKAEYGPAPKKEASDTFMVNINGILAVYRADTVVYARK